MKYTRLLPLVLLLAGAGAACSINIPWEVMDNYDGVRVVMHVTPDDADVLLNGRYIGAAYEYATAELSLRLASRENKLEFRKKGFLKKAVDLRGYSSRRITLKLDLETAGSRESGTAADVPEDRQAYEAKSEPLPPQPADKPAAPETRFLTLVALTVTPEETAVYIDNRFWGLSTAERKTIFLRLPPGKYVFTAFKPGYTPFSKELSVPRQEKFTLAIDLQK
ncbi:MAG: PEGA domain-containing protein [Acidobacteriota bacterium]|nr:PEGA domain-containing protein [Acidobacteriota bacterium]